MRELADSLPESAETAALGLAARIFSLQYGWRLGVTHEDAEAVFTEAEQMAAKQALAQLKGDKGDICGTGSESLH